MSNEYLITASSAVPLARIAIRLEALGLATRELAENSLSMVDSDATDEQVARWGASVEIIPADGGVLVTINSSRRRPILQCIVDELEAAGIAFSVDEP